MASAIWHIVNEESNTTKEGIEIVKMTFLRYSEVVKRNITKVKWVAKKDGKATWSKHTRAEAIASINKMTTK